MQRVGKCNIHFEVSEDLWQNVIVHCCSELLVLKCECSETNFHSNLHKTMSKVQLTGTLCIAICVWVVGLWGLCYKMALSFGNEWVLTLKNRHEEEYRNDFLKFPRLLFTCSEQCGHSFSLTLDLSLDCWCHFFPSYTFLLSLQEDILFLFSRDSSLLVSEAIQWCFLSGRVIRQGAAVVQRTPEYIYSSLTHSLLKRLLCPPSVGIKETSMADISSPELGLLSPSPVTNVLLW